MPLRAPTPRRNANDGVRQPRRGEDPLVARERELAALHDLWQRTFTGNGGLILVTGDVGVGRTRLLEALVPAVTADGAQILFESAARDAALRTNEEIADRLLALADRAPVLIVFDDFEEGNPAALHRLVRVAAAARSTRLLVAVAASGDAATRGLHGELDELALYRLRLEPFDDAAVAQFAERSLARPLPARLVAEPHAHTRGNPLFVRELLRLLVAQGGFADEKRVVAVVRGVPRVQDAIEYRLAGLTESSRRLLALAAAQGIDFDVGRLRELTGGETERFLDRLDEVEDAGVVGPSPWTPDRYRFAHPLLRSAARAAGTSRRQRA